MLGNSSKYIKLLAENLLVLLLLKATVASMTPYIVSSNLVSRATHGDCISLFLSVLDNSFPWVRLKICLVVAPALGALQVSNCDNFCSEGPSLRKINIYSKIDVHKSIK